MLNLFNKINVALYSMKPIKKLFQAKVFDKYGQKKSELDSLQDQFIKNAPSQIKSYAKIRDKIGEVLVVEAISNSIGHLIKMSSTSILKGMNSNHSLKLKKIRIKIAVQNPVPENIENKISISSITPMKDLSNKINNSPLKIYLKKILKHKK
tara:strand:- start:216 stop:671 length:456 start_codon:yes stop_codon:yes gene_type:complete